MLVQPELLRLAKRGTNTDATSGIDWDAELAALTASEAALV